MFTYLGFWIDLLWTSFFFFFFPLILFGPFHLTRSSLSPPPPPRFVLGFWIFLSVRFHSPIRPRQSRVRFSSSSFFFSFVFSFSFRNLNRFFFPHSGIHFLLLPPLVMRGGVMSWFCSAINSHCGEPIFFFLFWCLFKCSRPFYCAFPWWGRERGLGEKGIIDYLSPSLPRYILPLFEIEKIGGSAGDSSTIIKTDDGSASIQKVSN